MIETTEDASTVQTSKPQGRNSAARKMRGGAQALINLALVIWAIRDIRHRRDEELKGSRKLWTMVSFVTPLGPIAYFLFGRKRDAAA